MNPEIMDQNTIGDENIQPQTELSTPVDHNVQASPNREGYPYNEHGGLIFEEVFNDHLSKLKASDVQPKGSEVKIINEEIPEEYTAISGLTRFIHKLKNIDDKVLEGAASAVLEGKGLYDDDEIRPTSRGERKAVARFERATKKERDLTHRIVHLRKSYQKTGVGTDQFKTDRAKLSRGEKKLHRKSHRKVKKLSNKREKVLRSRDKIVRVSPTKEGEKPKRWEEMSPEEQEYYRSGGLLNRLFEETEEDQTT